MTTIDVARLRADTPGCSRVLHFNNAGSSLPTAPVLEAQLAHLRLEAEIGGYEAADQAAPRVDRAYAAIAALLNAQPNEIAVVENATRAFDMAFYAFPFRAGDRILTSEVEYASNYLAFLQVARRLGVVVEPIASEPDGTISLPALRAALARDGRARLVALTHVPTNGGLVNPAAEVGAACREAGVPFLLDACQSAGQMPLDVEALGCDVLSATARKFLRGPRGVGFLYVRSSLIERLEPPFVDLHAATWTARDSYELRPDARRFENWEGNVAAKIGLGLAVDYALALGLPAIRDRVVALAERLRRELGRAARRPRPRPGHLEVRHRHLRRRRSWARGDPGRAPHSRDQRQRHHHDVHAARHGRAAASARWCAPPSTTTTPRTRSTASAASCAPSSEPGRQGRRSTLPVVFRPSRAR